MVPVAVVLGAVSAMQTGAHAASVSGTWLRPQTGALIRIIPCGGGLGMQIVKSKQPRAAGRRIMCGARKTGANRFEGDLLHPLDGNTYRGFVEVNGNRLILKGCVLGGLICKTENWTRAK